MGMNFSKKIFVNLIVILVFYSYSSISYSGTDYNLLLLPDPFDCHQMGIEKSITNKTRLEILAVANCDSDRPAYGKANDNVSNSFSRILIPWTYSKSAWRDGYFTKVLVGVEHHEFESTLGSTANVTFTDISAHFGYQWFWQNGLNVSASLGAAYLYKNSLDKTIDTNETSGVVDFLDKNTKTNQHLALGIILGWVF
jgi:hypothetical protein